ncbi:hypothetical protein C8J56DRAFT_1156791 [Mycena floridula]|nr:hypothetical protein C8J56DRAFT_1156791 [Mycena floridula]
MSTPKVIDGGPGTSHDYMLPHTDLAADIHVVFYDQTGTARSSHITSKPATFWTIELFINELENLLQHLKITSYDVVGHSWGGGIHYFILYHRVRARLIEKLPKEVGENMWKDKEAGTTLDPEYLAAWQVFYAHYACKLDPIPAELIFSISQSEDPQGGEIGTNGMNDNVLDGSGPSWTESISFVFPLWSSMANTIA